MKPLTIYTLVLVVLFGLPSSRVTANELIWAFDFDKDSIPTGVPLPIKGKRVDLDTMPAPTTQSWLQPPIVTQAHPNVRLASPPIKKLMLKEPIPRVHGENGFPEARTIEIKGKIVPAKQAERVFALPPQNQNIHGINFKSLNQDHGLQSDALQTLLQDSKGCIWIGTMGKGMIRYDGSFFTQFGIEQGLSGNFVNDIIEDKQGNLWITTLDGGFNYFDGENFIQFTETEGLTRNDTYSIVEDRFGNLWIAGGWELMRISPGSQNNTTTLTFFLPENTALGLLLDSKGHLWIGVHEGGVWHFDGKFFRHYTEREGFTNQTVRQVTEDRSGNIWFGTLDGLFKLSGGSFTLIDDVAALLGRNITTIEEDSKGSLWIGSLEGICYYDGNQFECFKEETGFSHNLITDIIADEQGQIWIATPMGLNLFPERQFYHYYEKNGLQAAEVNSIVEDSAGALWFSSFRGGVSKYDGQFLTQWTQLQGLASNQVGTIFEDQMGTIWIGTNEGLYQFHENGFTRFTEKEGLNGNHISAMINDREGNMWIGTYDGGLCKYDQRSFTHFTSEHGLSDDFVSSIFEDREGRLWLGTRDGLSCFEPGIEGGEGTIKHYNQHQGVLSYTNALLQDDLGHIWFSSNTNSGNNFLIFDGNDFKAITEKNGIKAKSVHSAIRDNESRFWLGTDQGIELLIPAGSNEPVLGQTRQLQFSSYVFGRRDGVVANAFTRAAIIDTKNRIWWGKPIVDRGVNMLDLNDFELPSTPPTLVLDHIQVNQSFVDFRQLADSLYRSTVSFGKPLSQSFDSVAAFYNYPLNWTIPYQLNHLTFHFAAIDWGAPHKIRYQYQLEGQDEDWSQVTTAASADYRNLGWGKYTFTVRAIGEAQIWSEPFRYPFRILPPWWRTWWAYVLYLLTAIALLRLIYRYQLRRQLAIAEASRLVELDQIKSRFYTNITHEFRTPLTIIAGMADQVRHNPKEWFREGLDMIKRNSLQLLNLVNQLLDLSKLESGTLNVQMIQDDLVAYLKYLTESFHSYASSKDIRLHLLPEVEAIQMDFDPKKIQTIISNLVSNAIKFTPAGGNVYLKVNRIQDEAGKDLCQLRVSDTGEGIPAEQLPNIFDRFYQADDSSTRKAEGTGIGLALTRELIRLLQGSIEVKSQLKVGTEFTVRLPITQEAPMEKRANYNEREPAAAAASLVAVDPLDAAQEEDLPLALLIEDNQDVLRYLQACLKEQYRVVTARNGEEGISKALELIPDVIISDVMMPIKDGFEVVQTLKNDERSCHIPIILLTAKADLSSKLEGLSHGADAYLSKPFDEKELEIRLHKLIELRQQLEKRYRSFPNLGHLHPGPSLDNIFLTKLRTAVEEHLEEEDFGVEQLCRALAVSRTQLHRKLKALTGQSTTRIMRRIRLEKAKELLRNSDLTISEIGYAVGIASRSYFTQIFKEEYGESPGYFRKT